MGKWYDVAIASTSQWMKRHKTDAAIGSMELQSTGSTQTISMTRISRRYSTSRQSTHYCSLTPSYPPNRPRMTGIVCLLCRHDTCKSISREYQLTKTPGRFHYHTASEFSSTPVNPSASACRVTAVYVSLCVFAIVEWNSDVDAYVVHTNYNEYALMVTYKQNPGGEKTTSVKLYGKTWGFFSFMISNQTSTAYYL